MATTIWVFLYSQSEDIAMTNILMMQDTTSIRVPKCVTRRLITLSISLVSPPGHRRIQVAVT